MKDKTLDDFLGDKKAMEKYNTIKSWILEKYKDVECDINKRWEQGVQHHDRSLHIMNELMDLDFYLLDDFFCWKIGGDGDNGEFLMYLLDIMLEREDKLMENKTQIKITFDEKLDPEKIKELMGSIHAVCSEDDSGSRWVNGEYEITHE